MSVLIEGLAEDLAHESTVDVAADTVEIHCDIAYDHNLSVVVDLNDVGIVGARILLHAQAAGAKLDANRGVR